MIQTQHFANMGCIQFGRAIPDIYDMSPRSAVTYYSGESLSHSESVQNILRMRESRLQKEIIRADAER